MTTTDLAPSATGGISSLVNRCWVLDLPEGPEGPEGWHSPDEDSARKEAAEYADDHDVPVPSIRRLQSGCFVVICGCGYVFDVDDTFEEHFGSERAAKSAVIHAGWTADLRCMGCQEGEE